MVHSSQSTSIFDAYGIVDLPGGESFNTIRQLYTEYTVDDIYAYCSDPAGCNVFITILPFGWSFVPSALTEALVGISNPGIDTSYTYKWWAKGEDVPVAEVETDGPGGTALSAKYKLGNSVIAMAGGTTEALCKDSCDGTATVNGLGGSGSYTYVWDDPAAQFIAEMAQGTGQNPARVGPKGPTAAHDRQGGRRDGGGRIRRQQGGRFQRVASEADGAESGACWGHVHDRRAETAEQEYREEIQLDTASEPESQRAKKSFEQDSEAPHRRAFAPQPHLFHVHHARRPIPPRAETTGGAASWDIGRREEGRGDGPELHRGTPRIFVAPDNDLECRRLVGLLPDSR